MATVSKKELVDKITDATGQKQVVVKRIVQAFLDHVIIGFNDYASLKEMGFFER